MRLHCHVNWRSRNYEYCDALFAVIRNTLVQLGETTCKTPEAFKAWSQNLGHEKVMTTFLNYGEVAYQRQCEIIRGMAAPQHDYHSTDVSELVRALAQEMRDSGLEVVKR